MKYSTPYLIAGILILLAIGQSYTANGQTESVPSNVVINEVELNPSSDDSKSPSQWVELYNPTDHSVNIGGWTIGATSGLKQAFTIGAGTTIQSQQFIFYNYVPLWLPHAGAIIQLKDSNGIIIDSTPPLADTQADGNTWQRFYDGYDTDSPMDWAYRTGTPGFSNGKPQTTTSINQLVISVSTDKSDYIFGDTVKINGQVSQLVKNMAVTSIPEPVNLLLSGSQGFKKTFSLYPGNDFKFTTSVKADEVLGFAEGTYTISASYGDAKISTTFSLGSETIVGPTQSAPITMVISTDKPDYTISQPIILSGNVSQVIPLTPVKYKVYDPGNVVVYQGTIFPDSQGRITTVNPYQRSAGSSGLLINSVNPTYGIYRVTATYDTISTFTTFTLIPTQLQTSVITISTDKTVYAPGETVVIHGSTLLQGLQNLGLNPSLQIVQTTVGGSSGTQTSGNRGIVPNTSNVKTIVNLQTDNTFTYNFPLVGTSDGLGNYRVIASLPQGIAEADFVVVANPSGYQGTGQPTSPFSIITDKTTYALGEHIIISGQLLNQIQLSTQNAGANVEIRVFNSTGAPVSSAGSFINNLGASTSNPLIYFAFPDANGNFQVQQTIQSGIYHPGTYTLKASYINTKTSTTFIVYDPLASGSQGQIVASTDKKVYGIGDTVQLSGKISALTGTSSFTLNLLKPDGDQITFPLAVTNGAFSWTWVVPSTAKTGNTPITTDRSSSPVIDPTFNLYGIYRIKIISENVNYDLFFQVSKNPQASQDLSPIVVQTDKTVYLSTDVAKISGQVIPIQDAATKITNQAVQILIYSNEGQQVYRGYANINQGGKYYTTIPFHFGVWKTGTYKLYAQYLTNKIITSFKVTDPFTTSSNKLQLFMTTDADKYLPGQTVLVTGRTSYIVSVNEVDLAIGLKNETVISEGEVMSKKGTVLPKATVEFDQFGSFAYDYKIPNNARLGNYTIVAQVPFGPYYAYFNVVNQLPVIEIPTVNETQPMPTNVTTFIPAPIPNTIGPNPSHAISTNMFIEKFGRISDSVIPIQLTGKTVGNMTYHPRGLDGLLRVNPGNENNVNIKVSSQDGTCIIGPDENCLVSKSTVQSGMLYQTVTIGDTHLLVGYSGTGIRLQQFSILPANANGVLPEGQWNVSLIKNDQITRFYYQVTYR